MVLLKAYALSFKFHHSSVKAHTYYIERAARDISWGSKKFLKSMRIAATIAPKPSARESENSPRSAPGLKRHAPHTHTRLRLARHARTNRSRNRNRFPGQGLGQAGLTPLNLRHAYTQLMCTCSDTHIFKLTTSEFS
jgi:hypothetical protein